MEFFDQFDTAINRACSTSSSALNEERRKTILLREILTYKGYFNRNLFDFINWLVSSTERERYISKNCNIQFIRSSPSQGKTDPYSLLKVSIHAESNFSIAKKDKDWVKQSLSYWKKYCSETFCVGKQITSNWKKPCDVDQSPSSLLRKRSLSPQKLPKSPLPISPKSSISPTCKSPIRSPMNSASKTFMSLHSSTGQDLEGSEKKRRSVSPMKSLLPVKRIEKKKNDDQSSEISSLSCSITQADEFSNDAPIQTNTFRNDNLTVVMMQPLTAYTLLLNNNNQQFLEQSFTLQKMIMDDKAISRTTSTETTFRVSKEPVLINNTGSLHKSMDSFDGVGSNSSLSTFMVKLEDDIKSNGATVADTRLPTAEKTAAILPPESNITHADKGTDTNSEVCILNEGSSEKQEDVSRPVRVANSTADRSSQSEVVYSTPEKLQTNSILKQQVNSNDSDSKKSKKSVDFTGINFESGEELPIGEANNSDGKLYRLRYAQKLQSVKAEKNQFTDKELSLYKAVLQESCEVLPSNPDGQDTFIERDQTFSKHETTHDSMSASIGDVKSFTYRKNPFIMPKGVEKKKKSPSKAETAILRSLSDETICEAMKNGIELPKPQRLRASSTMDLKVLRAPLSPASTSSLPFPPKHIRSHSLESKSQLVGSANQVVDKFEKPKIFPRAMNYYTPQDQNDDSTVDASLMSVGEKDFDSPGPAYGQSSPESKIAFLSDPEFVQLKKNLDKVNEQYDALRTDFEKEKRKLSELWIKKSKDVHRSLILYKDASSQAIRKKVIACEQEKSRLEMELEVCQDALQKLYIFIDMNICAEKTAAKEKLRLRLESKERAVKAYNLYLDKFSSILNAEKDKPRQSSSERFQTLDKTHQMFCGHIRFHIQLQSDLITSEILDQLKNSTALDPQAMVLDARVSPSRPCESTQCLDKSSDSQAYDELAPTSAASPDCLNKNLSETLTGKMYKLDGQNQWGAVCLSLKKGVLSITPEENSKLNLLYKITCDERMELYDAPLAEMGSRDNIFYIQFADSFDSLSISSTTSNDKAISSNTEQKNNVIYLSTHSVEQKVEWIDAIAAAIKVNSRNKDVYTVADDNSENNEGVDTTIFQPEIWPIPFQPMVNLRVRYGSDALVQDGNAFTIDQFLNSPAIKFEAELHGFYTLLMVDLDSSTYEVSQCTGTMTIESILEHKEQVYLHWALLNITGDNISSGIEALPYYVSKDNGNMDGHRLFFLLFKQTAEINDIVTLSNVTKELQTERQKFSYIEWIKKMNFSDPVGLNGFYVNGSLKSPDEADEPFQSLDYDAEDGISPPTLEEYTDTAYFDDIYGEKEEPALLSFIYSNKPDPIHSDNSYTSWIQNEKESLPSPAERPGSKRFETVTQTQDSEQYERSTSEESKTLAECLEQEILVNELLADRPIADSELAKAGQPIVAIDSSEKQPVFQVCRSAPVNASSEQPIPAQAPPVIQGSNKQSVAQPTSAIEKIGQQTARQSTSIAVADEELPVQAVQVIEGPKKQPDTQPIFAIEETGQQQIVDQAVLLTESLEQLKVDSTSTASTASVMPLESVQLREKIAQPSPEKPQVEKSKSAKSSSPETPKIFSAKSSIAQRYIGSLNRKDSDVSDVSVKASKPKSETSKCIEASSEMKPSSATLPSVVKNWQQAVQISPKSSGSQQPALVKSDKQKDDESVQTHFKVSEVHTLDIIQQPTNSASEEISLVEKFEGNLMPLESFPSPLRESRDPDYFLDMEQSNVQRAKIELYEELSLQAIFQSPIDLSPLPSLDSISMNIYYPNMERVIGGGVISALVAQQQPSVSYKSHQGENYYTMILSDPDALWLLMDEHVHWVVVNIPGDQVSEGTVVLPYLGPAPAKGSGMHRFVFSLYRQTTLFNAQQVDDCVKHFRVRQGIRTHNFMTSLQGGEGINMIDSTPVGIEAFLCEWENGVDELTTPIIIEPVDNDDFSVENASVMTSPSASVMTSPSTSMLSPISKDSSHKSSSRSKRPKLSKQMRYYTDRILSMMVDRNASDEHKEQDHRVSTSATNSHEVKDNLKKRPLSFHSRNSSTASILDCVNNDMSTNFENAPQSSQSEKEQLIEDLNVKQPSLSSSLSSRLKLANLTPPKIISQSPLAFEFEDGRPDVTFIISPDNKDNTALPFHASSPKVQSNDDFEECKESSPASELPSPVQRSQSTATCADGEAGNGSTKNRGPLSILSRRIARIGSNGAIQNPLMLQMRSLSPTGVPRNSSGINSGSLESTNGSGGFPQIQLAPPPPRVRSQSPIVANGGTQKKFSPFLIMSLATSPKEVCNMLGIESTTMFDGEMIKKKFSTDFIFKENFIWMDSTSRSIHWAKNISEKYDPASSRYIMLAKTQDSNMIFRDNKVKQAEGEMRGTATKIDETPSGIAIHTDMGECLEMKMSGKQCEDWVKVLRTLNC